MGKRAIWDCIIVGAGPAGLGVSIALQALGVRRQVIFDRYGVGASFQRWPSEMRLITPSFPTNSIGMLDLNSIAIGTSPGYSLRIEHPTGREYAAYLCAVADHFKLPVRPQVEVLGVEASDDLLLVHTSTGIHRSKCVVWAAGEFQYPRLNVFRGAGLCLHNSTVKSWAKLSPQFVERLAAAGTSHVQRGDDACCLAIAGQTICREFTMQNR
jgi:putative flavoprotein involved in K+ transport